MNSYYTKLVSICFTLFTSVSLFAQKDFQGKAYYMSKTTVDMTNFGGGQMSEDQKKRIADRMKSALEKTYILTFNTSESIYKEEEKLEAPGGGGRGFRRMMMGSFTGGNQYKNIKEQIFLQEQEMFGKQFLIKESIASLEWKMEGETKQIGQYTCFKATAMKNKTGFDFGSFRRPNSNDKAQDSINKDKPKEIEKEIEMPKQVEVVAWYTPQIPVSQGPAQYWGLPGLILEVSEDRTTILCSKIIMNPSEKETIKAPSKGKEISREEYDVTLKKKMEEMRENFRRGGGRSGGGGGRR